MRSMLGWILTPIAAVVILTGMLLVIITPGLRNRRRVAAWTGVSTLMTLGCLPQLHAGDALPEGPCIVVANHASYLDGILLTALLPPRFSFVIKAEVQKVPYVSLLLRRLGSQFVDRSDADSRGDAGRQIMGHAGEGAALGFFPEGTFRNAAGLRPFHSGAFLAAIRSGLPVVPVTIQGTREALPEGRWFVRPTRLRVHILEPHRPPAPGAGQARRFAQSVRAAMLEALDEPDLA